MKVIEFKKKKDKRKMTRRGKLTLVMIGIIAFIVLVLFIIYAASQSFRDLLDKYVLMKNVVEDSTASITIDDEESNIYAYDKYICILSKNILKNYNSFGKEEGQLTVEISTPITATNGKYLLIAEKEKNRIYLISGNEIIWQKDLEGNIDKMAVNKNGYVAVVLSGTTYKSVIQTFDNSGDELFKTYLSSTTVIDVDISMDNQYLAFAEINTSGTALQSTIKTVSIQKAKKKDGKTDENPIIYTYEDTNGKLITNIKYQESNRLVCMYDDEIDVIKSDSNEVLASFTEEGVKVSFADVELNNNVYRIKEKSSLINTQTNVEIINTSNKASTVYTFEGVSKESYSYDDTIAINVGAEVHFISTNGWLIRKYLSTQEVKKVVLCNSFAGIVYRNKIEIVNI